jgi:hypothetical protein
VYVRGCCRYGYSAGELKAVGYLAAELKMGAENVYKAKEMKEQGFTSEELLAGGFHTRYTDLI